MIPKRFDQIVFADVQSLVDNGVPEGRTLEYKRELPGGSDDDKREFLADVSAFANAGGGDIVYGVAEKTAEKGKPDKIVGLPGLEADKEKLRLEDILRNGLDPRVVGIQVDAFDDGKGLHVLVLRVPRSWNSPHMVVFKNWSRFFSRTSAGKYQLDVDEIRAAFAVSQSIPEKLKRLRDDRLAKIIADVTPLPLLKKPRIVLHLVPLSALDPGAIFDVRKAKEIAGRIRPMGMTMPASWRFNFDGFVAYDTGAEQARAYVQIFRTGALEAVESAILGHMRGQRIPVSACEDFILMAIRGYVENLRDLDAGPPIFGMLTLVGVQGYTISYEGRALLVPDLHPIDRDVLTLPDFVIDDFATPVDPLIKPAFDAVWQACGWEGSRCYDATGTKWVGVR
ncbi:MAG: ATP-binding protein [Phycisphaerae bacterium]|nr:ATP-binding protein [Phycisphaerae bacterium]